MYNRANSRWRFGGFCGGAAAAAAAPEQPTLIAAPACHAAEIPAAPRGCATRGGRRALLPNAATRP